MVDEAVVEVEVVVEGAAEVEPARCLGETPCANRQARYLATAVLATAPPALRW